jgi:hypothetical protein
MELRSYIPRQGLVCSAAAIAPATFPPLAHARDTTDQPRKADGSRESAEGRVWRFEHGKIHAERLDRPAEGGEDFTSRQVRIGIRNTF